jgi:hypothetical protein
MCRPEMEAKAILQKERKDEMAYIPMDGYMCGAIVLQACAPHLASIHSGRQVHVMRTAIDMTANRP